MGIVKTWEDWFEDLGSGAGSYVNDVFQNIADASCSLMQKYPNRFGLMAPFATGFAKEICARTPFPINPPAPPPFLGGQCCDVLYTVQLDVWRQSPPNIFQSFTLNLINVVGAIYQIDIGTDGTGSSFLWYRIQSRKCDLTEVQTLSPLGGAGFTGGILDVRIFRQDGLPDDCGNVGGPLPPDPPFDASDFQFNFEIYNYDITGNQDTVNNFNVNFDFDIDNVFNNNFDLGGLEVNVDVGGINIGGRPPGGSASCCPTGIPEAPPEELTEQPVLTEEEEISGIVYAKVEVVGLPTAGKRLFNNNPDNIDQFAGFFSWIINDGTGTWRMSEVGIRKRKYLFTAPPEATGVKWYAVNGATLSVSVFTQ